MNPTDNDIYRQGVDTTG